MAAKSPRWNTAQRFHLIAALVAAVITTSLMLGIDELADHYSAAPHLAAAAGVMMKA